MANAIKDTRALVVTSQNQMLEKLQYSEVQTCGFLQGQALQFDRQS